MGDKRGEVYSGVNDAGGEINNDTPDQSRSKNDWSIKGTRRG